MNSVLVSMVKMDALRSMAGTNSEMMVRTAIQNVNVLKDEGFAIKTPFTKLAVDTAEKLCPRTNGAQINGLHPHSRRILCVTRIRK